MKRDAERGMVLVACLLILAILSLLGAMSLFTATLDAQFVGNQMVNREAFYAAEAALEVGTGKVMSKFRDDLKPFKPDYTWHHPSGSGNQDPFANPFNGYTTSYRIANGVDPQHPGTEPRALPYSTMQNGQEILHFAYTYAVEGEAEGPGGRAKLTETLRALETPLVQYYVFFQDDLSWHHGPPMTSWGRIHTNGDLYMAPQGESRFQNFNDAAPAQLAPNQITVSGKIHYGKYLAQNGGVLARAAAAIYVKVKNLAATVWNAADAEEIVNDIDSQAAMDPFKDTDDVYHVRVGADQLPTVSSQPLQRYDFYEKEAKGPGKEKVDGITVLWENGRLSTQIAVQGRPRDDVTDELAAYEVAAGVSVNLPAWSPDAATNANGVTASLAAAPGDAAYLVRGTIVYGAMATVGGAPARGVGSDPWYPAVLERQDGREVKEVDLTVIDLQRLQYWYRDYLDLLDNGAVNGSNWNPAVNPGAGGAPLNPSNRSLLIYTSRTDPAFVPTTGGAGQAVKLIGSRAGRTRGTRAIAPGDNLGDERQSGPTLLTRTTLVTDNPVYLEGDFNAPGASGNNLSPGAFGCAILSDSITLLSNQWGSNTAALYNGLATQRVTYGQTSGNPAGRPLARDTVFNVALFTGRYDIRSPTAAGGEEAGIHNFVRFLEDWDPTNNGVDRPAVFNALPQQTCSIRGCLINLWFSRQATGPHGGGYYSPPTRVFGWDVNFANPNYWPPYVPSIYSVERVAWRVDK